MEKEENQNSQSEDNNDIKENKDTVKTPENKDLKPEDKVKELEDKLARAYAEIENQRRRFEKEKDEAFDYGGFSLARETLNLIDNLERSKESLKNDEKLKNTEALKQRVKELLLHHNALRRGLGINDLDYQSIVSQLSEIADKILPYSKPVWRVIDQARNNGKLILFEGAQGGLLDIDHGTYPFVTSSNTMAGQVGAGAGVGSSLVNFVLGITKAYTTRVGSGPFPTELNNDIGSILGEKGKEFGTVTGRKRRCGWFDAVLVRQMAKIGGISGIALTKLDVLDGIENLQVCTGYKINGETLDYLPSSMIEQAAVEPIYEVLEGWGESTKGARSWADLPATTVKYVRRIEELIQVPVSLLSTSPEREDTILVQDPFA